MKIRTDYRPVTLLLALLLLPTGCLHHIAPAIPDTGGIDHALNAALSERAPASPRVIVGEFANGFRYYIRENQRPRNRAELRLVVRAGSVLEEEDQIGLAHFLEHMAFNGTENFKKQELLGFMESIGMRLGPGINASTNFDQTIYMLRIPTDSRAYLTTSFQILEDWAHGLTLDGEEIDQERGVVIEEWRGGRGVGARVRDQLLPILFKDSRYARRLPIGTRASLESFDHEALRRFYRDWYRPERIGVIAVGDFDSSEIEALMARHFAELAASSPAPDRPDSFAVPEHPDTLFSIVTDPEVRQATVAVYHKMPHHDDWTIGGHRQHMVESLYNSLLNSRFSEIARQPGTPILGAGSSKGRLIGSKGSHTLTAVVPEDGIERGLETLFIETARVARHGFTASELAREKINAMRGMERAYMSRATRTSSSFVSEYTRAFLHGEPIPGIEYEFNLYKRFLPTITLAEVNQIGRAWIREADRVVAITAPDKEGLQVPDEQTLLQVIHGVEGRPIDAYVDRVSDQPLLAAVPAGAPVVATRSFQDNITEWRLKNGVRVILKPTDFQQDQIVFRSFSPGGYSLASDEDHIPATTAISVIAGAGLGSFSTIELRKKLAGKLVSVNPVISLYGEGLVGQASPRDLETMFQLVYLAFRQPRADSNYFQVYNMQRRRALANRDAAPSTAFNDAYNRIMTQDHPRLRPFTIESFQQTNLEKSLAFYKDRFADAGDHIFIFVGDLDPDTIRPLVERYLGGLPSTGRQETWRDLGIRFPTGVVTKVVFKGLEPRSQTRIAFTGQFDYQRQAERTVIRAIAMLLQTRLHDLLREELGETYSVGVRSSTSFRPVESYALTISFACAPERAEAMAATVATEIERMRSRLPTEKEVSDVREAMLRTFETSLRQNRTWLAQLSHDYQRQREPGASLRSFPASVRGMTPASIRQAASRYFNMENQVRVVLMPQEK